MNYQFRKAEISEHALIWELLQQGIQRRKADGSDQWQDGYPNADIVQKDLEKGQGFVLTENKKILGYCAALINDEPQYEEIEGAWLSTGDFVVVHRVVIDDQHLGKGLSGMIMKEMEAYALSRKVLSIKVDTNHDNPAMIRVFEKLGYSFCGTVYFRGCPRKAFEKVLKTQ